MITLLFKVSAITFLVTSVGFIGSTAKAETESETSPKVASETIKNSEAKEEKNSSEDELEMRVTAGDEFSETITPERSVDFGAVTNPSPGIEVNPSAQKWEEINTGDYNRDTIKFQLD